jgi:hypothetical protein
MTQTIQVNGIPAEGIRRIKHAYMQEAERAIQGAERTIQGRVAFRFVHFRISRAVWRAGI